MSRHSTAASRSTFASIRSARRWRYSARPAGPSAGPGGKGLARPRATRELGLGRAAARDLGERLLVDRRAVDEPVGARDALAADEVVRRDLDACDLGHSSAGDLDVVDRVAEGEAEALDRSGPARAQRAPRGLAPKSSSVADPSQISETTRSRLRERASSCTAGSSWRPASRRAKWRTLTIGGALCVGPAPRTRARASRCPRRAGARTRRRFPRRSRPRARPGSAAHSRPWWRVIQIEPSFFGNPWSQPRASAKSRSTQM